MTARLQCWNGLDLIGKWISRGHGAFAQALKLQKWTKTQKCIHFGLSLRKIHHQTFQIPQNFTKSTKNLFFLKKIDDQKKPIKLSLFIGFLSVFYRFIGFSSFWKKWKKWKKNEKMEKNPIGLYNTIWKSEIYRWRVDYYVYFYKNRTQSEKHLISPTS